ncbi:hypothetical protein CO009_00315 [Candidatus Shapirobacteria bacterium CG_4_8_14_3_um_filter_35_11]|uniref:Uncharacterized protein n=5 Tax=Candidatus Shapironibacteriota TaxID=1752721 RepID=A0A1J5HR81_9BACT|nr:MAG: hypothetical protein AUK05_02365 [Candidatus Shapirobacteria bacterium CG2_30_35_20]PIX68161.1 MAG: hypothetical protein COZ41_01190 [Candidatus Shapirobacteria bacterium CG_4_10_14_3_um_filter_35_13]PJA51170.1 MAG: hypothetical protein CO168_01270 [Candidatus Shapirobacteria bacterium CG_4_9_14_3_um_filter_36_12]PJC81117.1 MAG: hypothetical protein CO009_00315 [Candidatus Shapirobacteria bacterium CG_4_8_14_3_um_filter_35_11]PJE66685.1 MAG: hypothetical protein COU93_02965 [Candidatus 
MAIFTGLDCSHMTDYHPARHLFLDPKIEINIQPGKKLTKGMSGKCLARKSNGGECSHDCPVIRVDFVTPFLGGFTPTEVIVDGSACQAEKI